MKQLLSIFIFSIILLPSNATIYSGSCGSDLSWELNSENGHLSIFGSGEYLSGFHNDNFNDYRDLVKTVSIPDGVTTIGYEAFRDFTSLTSISIPNSVTTLEEWTFSYCTSLTEIVLPNNITSIPYYAFLGCSSLASINLPNDITIIEGDAFNGCSSLMVVNIPNNVTRILENAFANCSSLYDFFINNNWDGVNDHFRAIDGVLFSVDGKTLKLYPSGKRCVSCDGNYTIPSGVTCIDTGAFAGCNFLNEVVIPNTVTTIASGAFSGSSLTKAYIPNSVTTIGAWAFANTALDTLIIPESVTKIESNAFVNCSFSEFFCKATTPPSNDEQGFGFGIDTSTPLFVPDESLNLYKNADFWKEFTTIRTFSDKASVFESTSSTINNKPRKLLHDGHLSIFLPDGTSYNINGAKQ